MDAGGSHLEGKRAKIAPGQGWVAEALQDQVAGPGAADEVAFAEDTRVDPIRRAEQRESRVGNAELLIRSPNECERLVAREDCTPVGQVDRDR